MKLRNALRYFAVFAIFMGIISGAIDFYELAISENIFRYRFNYYPTDWDIFTTFAKPAFIGTGVGLIFLWMEKILGIWMYEIDIPSGENNEHDEND
jgi:hypothetical protein